MTFAGRVLLVTGTDSRVGKTWLARALGRALRDAGRRVVAIKPVETGCDDATRPREDGVLLAAATGQAHPRAALRRLSAPLAPALAADAAGETIDLDALVLAIEAAADGADTVLLEGAGGLLSPITWEWNAVDLARTLGAAVLVVGPDRQGVISHALLALSAIELAGVELAGLVLIAPDTPDPSTGTNAGAIARISGVDRVIALPQAEDPLQAAAEVGPILAWPALSAG
jgi:dethiobiotin synthetase